MTSTIPPSFQVSGARLTLPKTVRVSPARVLNITRGERKRCLVSTWPPWRCGGHGAARRRGRARPRRAAPARRPASSRGRPRQRNARDQQERNGDATEGVGADGRFGLGGCHAPRLPVVVSTRPVGCADLPATPCAHDAPHCERDVQGDRRPHKRADEPKPRASVHQNRAGRAVVEQHHGDQPAPGAAGSIIARQPAADAQREQRSARDPAHDQRGRGIERRSEQQPGDKRRREQQRDAGRRLGQRRHNQQSPGHHVLRQPLEPVVRPASRRASATCAAVSGSSTSSSVSTRPPGMRPGYRCSSVPEGRVLTRCRSCPVNAGADRATERMTAGRSRGIGRRHVTGGDAAGRTVARTTAWRRAAAGGPGTSSGSCRTRRCCGRRWAGRSWSCSAR